MWVQFPPEEMKYLIFSFLHSGESTRKMRNGSVLMGLEWLNTRYHLPTFLRAGCSAKLKKNKISDSGEKVDSRMSRHEVFSSDLLRKKTVKLLFFMLWSLSNIKISKKNFKTLITTLKGANSIFWIKYYLQGVKYRFY